MFTPPLILHLSVISHRPQAVGSSALSAPLALWERWVSPLCLKPTFRPPRALQFIQWRVTLARPGSPPSDWGERTTRGQAHLLQGEARTRAAFPGPRGQETQQSRAEAQLPAWRGFWDARRGQAHGRSGETRAEHRYAGAQPITATLPLGSRPPAGALPARLESWREGASPRHWGARSDISSKLRLGDEASQIAPYSRCHPILPRVQQPLLSRWLLRTCPPAWTASGLASGLQSTTDTHLLFWDKSQHHIIYLQTFQCTFLKMTF